MRLALCRPAFAMIGVLGMLGGLVGLGSAGCSRDRSSSASGGAAGGSAAGSAGSAAAAGYAPAPAGVEIFVDDTPVGRVALAQLAGWPRVDTLIPPEHRRLGTWASVALHGARAAPTEVTRPSASFPDMVPAVFPDGGGGAAFGMFDAVELARKGKPALREDGVTAIRIKLAQGTGRGQHEEHGGGDAADPAALAVTVTSPAGTTTLRADQLLALPREAMPGHPDQRGWRLAALLDAAKLTSYQRLVLRDASGTTLVLDRADVSDTSVPFIKLNKQGVLRLRVLKQAGDGWNIGGDLRALVAIDAK